MGVRISREMAKSLGIVRPRSRPTGMNKSESWYAGQLELMKLAGEIFDYKFEAIKLRLADKTFYTPDFLVILQHGGIEFHEVKGFWEDDARVKIKVAAEMFPWFRFRAFMVKSKGGRMYVAKQEEF